MKIYVTGMFYNRHWCKAVAKKLRDDGHEITSTWHERNFHEEYPPETERDLLRRLAEIKASDALIFLPNTPINIFGFWAGPNDDFNANVIFECGYAAGAGMHMFAIDQPTIRMLRMFTPYQNVDAIFEAIKRLEGQP